MSNRRRLLGGNSVKYIQFADPEVERICLANWDTDHDGKLSYEEAEAVTSIGTQFRENNSISSFAESEHFIGVTKLGVGAFYNTTQMVSPIKFMSLTNIVTPLQGYAYNAFHNSGITEFHAPLLVILPDAYQNKSGAFQSCTNLTTVSLSAITKIGSQAFWGCSNLSNIGTFDNLKTIGRRAFQSCSKLEVDFNTPLLTSLDYAAFSGSGIKSFIAPLLTTILDDNASGNLPGAFQSCTKLTTVSLSAITKIGSRAFQSCSNLTTLIIDNVTPPTLGSNALASTPSTMSIYVPDSAVDTYKAASGWSSYASRIKPMSELPDQL